MPAGYESLMALSPEELRAGLQSGRISLEQARGYRDYLKALEPEPSATSSLFSYLGETAGNVPRNVGELAQGAWQMATSPLETVKQGINLYAGQQDLMRGDLTSPRSIEAGQALAGDLPTAENFKERPLSVAANVAGLASPLLKSVGGAGRIAQATRMAGNVADAVADPVQTVVRGGIKGAQIGGQALGAGAKIGLGATTGARAGVIDAAFKENRAGRSDAFNEFLSERRKGDDLVDDTIANTRNERAKVNYDQRLSDLAPESYQIDIRDLKQQVASLLSDEYRVPASTEGGLNLRGLSTVSRTERPRFAAALDELLSAPDQVSGLKLDTIKRSLGDSRIESTAGSTALNRAQEIVGDRLRREIPGYGDLMDDWESVRSFEKEIKDAIGVDANNPGKRATVESALDNALTENKDVKAAAIDKFEQRTGQPLRAQIAGKALSQTDPAGLVGRQTFATLLGGLGLLGGAVIDPLLLTSLAALPAFIPRQVGRGVGAAGRFVGGLDGLAEAVRTRLEPLAARRGIPTATLRGLTIGQAVERIAAEEEPTSGIMRGLGGVGRY